MGLFQVIANRTAGLVVMSIMAPIGLVYMAVMGSTVVEVGGVNYTLSAVINPAILTIFNTLIPLGFGIGALMFFLPSGKRYYRRSSYRRR